MKAFTARILCCFLLLFSGTDLHAAEVVVQAVGDVMLAGRWAGVIRSRGYGHPFESLKGELAVGDVNLANLESPIADCGTECTTKRFRFRAEPAVAPALRAAGFNMVTLANNHSMDYGAPALAETLRHLERAGIAWVGAGASLDEARRVAIHTVKGRRIAFLGYSLTQPVEFFAGAARPGTAPGYVKLVAADVAAARRQADHVIVSFHWGREGSGHVQEYQRQAAHAAIDAGADVIIGHHPHVLQGIERYKGGIIFYSLGNFAFASRSTTADVAALVRLRLDDARRSAEILPLDVLNRRVGFQPRLLAGERGDAVIRRLNELSRPFGTVIGSGERRNLITF